GSDDARRAHARPRKEASRRSLSSGQSSAIAAGEDGGKSAVADSIVERASAVSPVGGYIASNRDPSGNSPAAAKIAHARDRESGSKVTASGSRHQAATESRSTSIGPNAASSSDPKAGGDAKA